MYVAVRSAIIVWMFIYPHQNIKSLDLYDLPSSAGLVIRIMLHCSCGVTLTCFFFFFLDNTNAAVISKKYFKQLHC